MRYVAFLRGINVGGNKKVPMADLRSCLEKAGFKNVKTLLNSGNVAFDASAADDKDIRTIIEKQFGFSVDTLVRTQDSLKKIVAEYPFKGVKVADGVTLYVTFFRHKPEIQQPKNFTLVRVTDDAVCWYIDRSQGGRGTLNAMEYWDKHFGKEITTRNYNTILKAAEL